MAYISSDGRLQQSRPFGISYIVDLFWGFIGFFVFFFRSLFHMDDPSSRGQYGNPRNSNSRAFPQAWPRRRMGGFSTGSMPSPPPCAPGGG